MFRLSSKSSGKTERFLESIRTQRLFQSLEKHGERGVAALRDATPVRSGRTRASWDYVIERTNSSVSIIWTNSNDAAGTPIALLIQYGHGTGTGGYVPGMDYINPAIKPVFDRILDDIWRQVKNG